MTSLEEKPQALKQDWTGLPMRALLERVDHGIALTDAAGILRWCNPLLADCYLGNLEDDGGGLLGRAATEIFRPLFHEPGHWDRVVAAVRRLGHAPKGRIEIENLSIGWGGRPMRRIDLVLCDLAATTCEGAEAAGAETAGPGWVAWYFYDATALRKTEENLQALLRHSNDGIFMIDAECRLRVFNEACQRITGYPAEDALLREVTCNLLFQCSAAECPHEAARPAGEANALCFMRAGSPQTRELPIRTKTGGQVWVEISYAPVLDEAGRIAYVLGILRDVTQRRQLEEQLRVARKLATLGELTSAMAHEIKNPLGIIMSAAEVIMNPERPEEQRRQAAEYIREETHRLDERMRVFLNFSRPRPPEFKPQSIHRVLAQTIIAYETLAREGLTIKTDYAPCLPHTRIDADQMQQVFLNLFMNADQAMREGGAMTISTRREGDGWIAVEVSDEGPGLPAGKQEQLFEPFFSTKPRGTGLGLAIVMHIVTAHGGRVEARNRAGREGESGETRGACFTVLLPCE